MVTHSSTLAWKIPWMEESGRLQSMGSLRVRHDWATWLSLFIFIHWKRSAFIPIPKKGNAKECSNNHTIAVISHTSMEKAMATHSNTLAWKIPWMEESGRLQSMGSLQVRHDWVTSLSLFTFIHWRRKWQPTPVFLPGESQDGGAWWATIYGVT